MQRLYIFIFIICIIILSCDEGVIPEGNYNERYILTGILKPESDSQLINLAYSTPNVVSSLIENKPIKDAELNIWFDDEIRKFNPTQVEMSDTIIDGGKLDVYQNSNLKVEAGKTYEIEALMANGRRLKANTTVPEKLNISISPIDRKIDPNNDKYITLNWDSDDNNYKVVRTYLIYEKPVDGEKKTFKIQIPEKYLKVNEELVPSYSKPEIIGQYELKTDIIDKELKKIGEGVSKKYEITIKYIYIELFSYDKHLTKYYESTRKDKVSGIITVDKESYSNIEGGVGIFASYNYQKTSFFFDFEYIFKLGFTPADIIE